MSKAIRLGMATVGLAGALAACGGDSGTDDAATPRTDAYVPPGIDAGPIDANEAAEPDAFVAMDEDAPGGDPDAFAAPDAFMGGGDDCMRTGYPALSLVDVAPGYDWTRPVYLTHPPGSPDLYVVDARGYIYLVRDGMVNATPFLDMRSTIGTLSGSGDERGLLGLAFHPDYATNGRFFVGFTPVGGENTIGEGHRSAGSADVADSTITGILTIPDFASNHNGGMVEFGPDGYLYIGTGDGGGGGDPMNTAQDPSALLGKMLRIDVDGTAGGTMYRIPADNPFVGVAGVREEIWAFGYRNPWRFSFDGLTNEMYIADVGQGAWEEIDVEPAGMGGRNYGWSRFEGTHNYSGGDDLRPGDTHTPPVYEFPHDSGSALLRGACSVTGGYVYRGAAIPGLRGAYVFGDYCSTDVAAFRFCGGEVREPMRLDFGAGVGSLVSFGQDSAGELYVVSFGSGAQVRRVVAR